jgi:hypothetical protein
LSVAIVTNSQAMRSAASSSLALGLVIVNLSQDRPPRRSKGVPAL